jgi:hypothetical protein
MASLREKTMFMLVSVMIRAMVMVVVLTVRLMYWISKGMFMLIVAITGAISASRAERRHQPLRR